MLPSITSIFNQNDNSPTASSFLSFAAWSRLSKLPKRSVSIELDEEVSVMMLPSITSIINQNDNSLFEDERLPFKFSTVIIFIEMSLTIVFDEYKNSSAADRHFTTLSATFSHTRSSFCSWVASSSSMTWDKSCAVSLESVGVAWDCQCDNVSDNQIHFSTTRLPYLQASVSYFFEQETRQRRSAQNSW